MLLIQNNTEFLILDLMIKAYFKFQKNPVQFVDFMANLEKTVIKTQKIK